MKYDLVVRSRRAALPDGTRPAAVAVSGPAIAGIADYGARLEAGRDVDLGDLALLPGLVDSHVHVNEPGRTEWEGFATATRAAAAGGVTTICDMPLNSLPPTTSVAALEEKRAAAAGKCWVDVAFWGGAVPGNEASLRPLHEAGVVGFKCFLLDSGVPEFPPLAAAGLRSVLGALAGMDALLIVHAEDAAEIKEIASASGRDFGSFVASRPPVAERRAIEKVISAAAATGARAHIVHLSAAECAAMRYRLAPAWPVRGVDGRAAARPDPGRHGPVDGVGPGRAGGPAGEGEAGGRLRRRPGGLRPRRDVHRGPRAPAPPAPGDPVRGTDADRAREADVAARHAAA